MAICCKFESDKERLIRTLVGKRKRPINLINAGSAVKVPAEALFLTTTGL